MVFDEFIAEFKENMYAGDPTIRNWFMIKSDYAPALVCCTYALLVKLIIPWYMKDRRPYDLRTTMIVYNFAVVSTYVSITATGVYFMKYLDWGRVCINNVFNEEDIAECVVATCIWIGYLLKYVEFLDTIFFVLRKKDHLVTNLHVLHHTFVPFMVFVVLRSETSGFQTFPALLNTAVHIVMYTYYGLAAIGPSVQKYLWWKRYLTIFQMLQFVLILVYAVVIWPLTGCPNLKFAKFMTTAAAVLFFGLFFNFYSHTFLKGRATPTTATPATSPPPGKEDADMNGHLHQ